MVEFVIVLIFILAMVVGMVATMRLLTFQFWAQQEARYLAFEQTWAAKLFYDETGGDPDQLLQDGERIKRPQLVTDRDTTKETEDAEGARELLMAMRSDSIGGLPLGAIGDPREAPVMVARASERSIWEKKTSEWFQPGGALAEGGLVSTAYAREAWSTGRDRGGEEINLDDEEVIDKGRAPTGFEERLAEGIRRALERGEFGVTVCEGARDLLVREGFKNPPFDPECARDMNRQFANHIAANVDIPELYRDYGIWLDEGIAPGDAVRRTLRNEVSNQFYSFYDTLVSSARTLAPVSLITDRLDRAGSFLSNDFTRLGTDFRYIGSAAAIGVIAIQAAIGTAQNPLERSASQWKEFEDNAAELLHTDAEEVLPFGIPYFLNPTYLPVPPTFGAFGASLHESVMRQALFEEDELEDPLIDQSNKMVKVDYQARGGLFTPALKIPGVENPTLEGRFFLMTQEWHITRRPSPNADYRDKGDQFDDIGEDTEEGILRRRVSGLWLFPSNFAALLEPLGAIPGLGFLDGVVAVLEPVGSIIGELKSFLLDNPFIDIVDFLSEIPGFGSFIPTLPKWPAVRPDAYPGSTELAGSAIDDPDKLMGSEREFQDYVDEQREFNPEPKPVFND